MNAELFSIAQYWAPYCEAAGMNPATMSPHAIYLEAGKLIHDVEINARAQELSPPGIVTREALLQAVREKYSHKKKVNNAR